MMVIVAKEEIISPVQETLSSEPNGRFKHPESI
jgi:hypothetical protein